MKTLMVIIILVGLTVSLQATPVNWGTPALIKHDSDIENAGETAVATMLFHAVSGGLSTGEVTVNEITFATNHNVNLGEGNIWVQTSNWPYNNNNAGALSYLSGLSTNMQALLDKNVLGGTATTETLALNNLTVGAEYRAQFLMFRGTETIFDINSGGNSVAIALQHSGTSNYTAIVTGVFIADSTTQTFSFTGSGNRSVVNAVNVRSVSPIIWGSPALITGDDDIDNRDATAVATMLNPADETGLPIGEVTVNGITFATNRNVNLGAGNVWVETSGWSHNNNNAGGMGELTGLSTNMKALLDRNVLGGNATAGALTLNNLTVGAEYRAQFLMFRSTFTTFDISSVGNTNSVAITLQNGTSNINDYTAIVMGTFTAYSTTRKFLFKGSARSLVNAVNVRLKLPEGTVVVVQ